MTDTPQITLPAAKLAQRIAIPLDERGMPVMSAELKAQIAPLLNLNALHKALAKAAQITNAETMHMKEVRHA